MHAMKAFVGAAVLMAAGACLAQQLSREAVIADLVRARDAGEMQSYGEAWDGTTMKAEAAVGAQGRPFDQGASSREQVAGELAAGSAIRVDEAWDGMLPASAAAGSQGRAFAEPGLTREAVKAELEAAQASGEMQRRFMSDYIGGD